MPWRMEVVSSLINEIKGEKQKSQGNPNLGTKTLDPKQENGTRVAQPTLRIYTGSVGTLPERLMVLVWRGGLDWQ